MNDPRRTALLMKLREKHGLLGAGFGDIQRGVTPDVVSAQGESGDRLNKLVDQMLEAKKQLAPAQTERDKTFFENKCARLDRPDR
jgi:hypothetical protein